MKRRDFCWLAGASSATALITSCQSERTSRSPALSPNPTDLSVNPARLSQKPNVLFISIDDLNDWVGVLGGHPQAKTPNFDRFSQRGVLFRRAYCSSPTCNSSRSAVLTGVPSHLSGVYDNHHDWRAALPNAITLPQLFHQNGYWVGGAGKIYHGRFPESDGWDESHPRVEVSRGLFVNRARSGTFDWSPRPQTRPVSGIPDPSGQFDWGALSVDVEEMHEAKVANWVSGQLQQERDRPFFLACGFFLPHLPFYAPQRYFDAFPLDKIQLPRLKTNDLDDIPPSGIALAKPEKDHANVLKYQQFRQAVQGYLASIYFSDDMLGRVLDALDAGPHSQNTIVVIWSDHGWHLGEKLHWRKGTLWEEATRVPLLISVPQELLTSSSNNQLGGAFCDRTVSLLDLYKTLADLCQIEVSNQVSGHSLMPLLKNPLAEWNYPAVMTWQHHASARSEQFRLIRYEDGTEEFYDHQTDPDEWNNLASNIQYQSQKRKLQDWLPKTFAADAPVGRKTITFAPGGY